MKKKTENWVIAIGVTLTLVPTILTLMTIVCAFFNGSQIQGKYQTVVSINVLGEAMPDLVTIILLTIFGFFAAVLCWRRIIINKMVET